MASPFGRPEEPPCDCRDCTKSFRTVEQQKQEKYRYSRSLSDTEAREVVQDALESIKNDYLWLCRQVEHNGDLIEERWKRTTRQRRLSSLKTAMGNYVLPRDLVLWRDDPFPSPGESTGHRKAVLLNYLTMNRLTIDPQRFLGMLWGRTYFNPREWAICDNQRLEWVWKSGSVKTDFSRLVLNIEPFTPYYWELVNWQPGIFKKRLALGFPRAILLLEVQQTLMTLLKNVVNNILSAGLPEIGYQEPFLYSNFLKYASEDELWCSYLNQPFTEPRCFNIPYMANTMALARSIVVAYHLRCLQTNPVYLQRMVFQITAALGPGRKEDDVVRQTVAEISYDIWNYWSWKLIVSACRNVLQQRVGFGTAESDREKEIWFLRSQAAFLEMSILLNEQLEDRASYLPLLLSSRESFSRYFTRNDENQVVLNENFLEEARNDDLFSLLWDISNIARSRHPTEVDVDTALASLEDRVRRTSIARDRIDERVYSCLSDLGAIHDFKSRLAVRRPAPDRTLARRFIKYGNIEASGYRILLNRLARKVRDTDFKNFDLPKADAPSKGLLRFLKAMKLQELRAEGLRPDGTNRVKLTLGTFWYMMHFQRHWLFENGVRQKKCKWTVAEIEVDLNHISVLIEGIRRPRISPTEQEMILGDIEIPELTQPDALSQRRASSSDSEETLPPSTEFATKTVLGVRPDIRELPADGTLKEVIIPVKDAWALIFKLAARSSEQQQETVDWKTFLIFMDDLVGVKPMSRSPGTIKIDQSLTTTKGFAARTSTFDCIFEPIFAKRVFVGKGQGNNVGEWKCGGAIDFRKPLPTGMLDGCMLDTMLGRLGNHFAENGIIVRFRRTYEGEHNGGTRIRRTEKTALPLLEDWGEDEWQEEGQGDHDEEHEHYASMRKESEKLAGIINQMQKEGKGVAGAIAKVREEDNDSHSDVEMTEAENTQQAAVSVEEDFGSGMGRVAEIVHEAAALDLNERAVNSTAAPTMLRIKIKKAEAEKTQESQKSENKRKVSSDGDEIEVIQQLAGKVDERQLRRKRTGNSQAETQQEDIEELVLSYNLRPRKRQRKT